MFKRLNRFAARIRSGGVLGEIGKFGENGFASGQNHAVGIDVVDGRCEELASVIKMVVDLFVSDPFEPTL